MTGAVTELLQEHVVAAIVKQARLRDAVDESVLGWSADIPTGRLEIGGRAFATELIGTESRGNSTFLWGWANPGFEESATPAALAVRALGESSGIPELVDDFEIPADRLDAFAAAVITVGVAGLDAYYLAPYEERGVLVLGVRDEHLRVGPPPAVTLASAFTNLLMDGPALDHRRAFAHYLANPLPPVPAEVAGGSVVLQAADAPVTVELDREGRIAAIRTDVRPGTA